MHDDELTMPDRVSLARMAVQERVLDRLAAALFDMYEILCFLDEDDAEGLEWMAPPVRDVYESVALLMKRVDD